MAKYKIRFGPNKRADYFKSRNREMTCKICRDLCVVCGSINCSRVGGSESCSATTWACECGRGMWFTNIQTEIGSW